MIKGAVHCSFFLCIISSMTLKDHLGPRKDWTNEQWLQHAHVQKHNPWITDEDRQYWKDKITELTS